MVGVGQGGAAGREDTARALEGPDTTQGDSVCGHRHGCQDSFGKHGTTPSRSPHGPKRILLLSTPLSSQVDAPPGKRLKGKDRTLKEELPRSLGAQYAIGDQWRNNSRKSEGMEPKQKHYPVVDVTGDRSSKDPIKSNTAQEPGMSDPRIKANWKWSNRR